MYQINGNHAFSYSLFVAFNPIFTWNNISFIYIKKSIRLQTFFKVSTISEMLIYWLIGLGSAVSILAIMLFFQFYLGIFWSNFYFEIGETLQTSVIKQHTLDSRHIAIVKHHDQWKKSMVESLIWSS